MPESQVFILDKFTSPGDRRAVSNDDVTAGEASAGNVETWSEELHNISTVIGSQVKAWLDPDVVNLEISANGSDWFTPIGREDNPPIDALDLADIVSGSFVLVYFRRTILAGAVYNPELLIKLIVKASIL